MGDLNYPDICWGLNSAKTAKSNTFHTSLADNFIVQKVEDATRGLAILDLILTNKEDLFNEVREMGNLGWSDQVFLEFEILRKGEVKHSQTRILDFNRADFSKLRELEEEEELVFIPCFSLPYGSLKAAYNRLPILSPQQTPCEVGGTERALKSCD